MAADAERSGRHFDDSATRPSGLPDPSAFGRTYSDAHASGARGSFQTVHSFRVFSVFPVTLRIVLRWAVNRATAIAANL
jgi:hypothetical protein